MLTAKRGWTLLVAGIVLYEALCIEDELLSRGFDRLLERHPVWPRLAVILIAAHLVNFIPERVDPVAKLFNRTKGLGRWGKPASNHLRVGRKYSV